MFGRLALFRAYHSRRTSYAPNILMPNIPYFFKLSYLLHQFPSPPPLVS